MVDDVRAPDTDLSNAQFRALANTIPNLAWMAHPDGWLFWYNQRWYEYTGTTPEEMAGWGWQSVHHPDVLPEMLERWTAAINSGQPFEWTFPLRRHDGSYRMFMTRAEPLRENGEIVGWYGSNTDITEQEMARERLEMVVNELNHRVKNTLATVYSIATQSFRQSDPEALKVFTDRLMALSAVHDVLTRVSWAEALVGDVVDTAIAVSGKDRFDVSGPELAVAPRLASNIAMTLHELSTNAVKYGALSVPGGRVALSWTVEPGRQGVPTLVLEWRESGGPAIAGPVTPGFGTKLVRRALASESGAQVSLTFPHEGAHFVARVPIRPDIMR